MAIALSLPIEKDLRFLENTTKAGKIPFNSLPLKHFVLSFFLFYKEIKYFEEAISYFETT